MCTLSEMCHHTHLCLALPPPANPRVFESLDGRMIYVVYDCCAVEERFEVAASNLCYDRRLFFELTLLLYLFPVRALFPAIPPSLSLSLAFSLCRLSVLYVLSVVCMVLSLYAWVKSCACLVKADGHVMQLWRND